jgi:hypothetical protein
MGANVSTSRQETTQKMITNLKENCHPTGQADEEIKHFRIKLAGHANCDAVILENRATASTQCNLDSLIKDLATSAAQLTDKQKAGLGFNVSTDIQSNEIEIRKYLELNCGSTSAIRQHIDGVNLTVTDDASCNLVKFMNQADAHAFCVSNVVTNAMSKISDKAAITQTGVDPTLMSAASAGVAILLLVLLAVGSGKMLMAGGALILIGLVLVVVGGVLWNKSVKAKKDYKEGAIIVGVGSCLFFTGIVIVMMSGGKKKTKAV